MDTVEKNSKLKFTSDPRIINALSTWLMIRSIRELEALCRFSLDSLWKVVLAMEAFVSERWNVTV
jgi:hypothetical protein